MRGRVLVAWFAAGALAGPGCGGDEKPPPSSDLFGGASGAAGGDGSAASGGSAAAGGSAANGGSAGSGGASAAGGSAGGAGTSMGGSAGASGVAGSGASSGDGGTAASGGSAVGGSAGASGGSAGASGGSAGASGGSAGAAGSGGTTAAVCGNGVREGTEACDGTDGLETCLNLGQGTGTTQCVGCVIDTSGCAEPENCQDGDDNDSDGDIDCDDSDCAAACADPCLQVPLLADPGTVVGSTTGHAATLTPGCFDGPRPDAGVPDGGGRMSGPEVAYRFVAANTGTLDVRLRSIGTADLTLSVRTSCGSGGVEVDCSEKTDESGRLERVLTSISKGQTVFVFVDGARASAEGDFRLEAFTKTVLCSDGFQDPGEQCDDANVAPNDGCGAMCLLEPDETEPNDVTTQADAYPGSPYTASIDPEGDIDVFSVAVTTAGSFLSASTFDMGDGACALRLQDSFVEILAPSGTSVIASDNDSGDGLCSRAVAAGLAPGTYFVRVSGGSSTPVFPYSLGIFVSP